MERPAPNEYVPYYEKYIALVPLGPGTDVLQVLEDQIPQVRAFFAAIPEARGGERYALGKWSVREVLGHLIDVERIMAFRALCIARGETKSLTGFEPDDYAAQSDVDRCLLADLVEELVLVRRANLAMLRRLSEEASRRMGTASDNPVSVRALAHIMAGHVPYHLQLLKERYGVGA
ncbi:MAG TPA: DinB family protein [Thermoanaerobaculia bacterium]|nr:DinB family protein [Thermoanaerobaculia bacterium]